MSSNHQPIRLALLVCDTHMPFIPIAGDYHHLFTTLLRKAGNNLQFVLDPYDVVDNKHYPSDPTDYDGILITGSSLCSSGSLRVPHADFFFRGSEIEFSAYQKLDWIDKLIEYVIYVAEHQPQVKIFGASHLSIVITKHRPMQASVSAIRSSQSP
jgi:hypothetical protein